MSVRFAVSDAPSMKHGDVFTMSVSIKRRWWQFWKPRWSPEMRTFRIVDHVPAPSTKDGFDAQADARALHKYWTDKLALEDGN